MCWCRLVYCCRVNCLSGDEVSGLSVSIRERDNLFQIWNTNSELHEKSTVIQKVKELLASIQFLTVFYTGSYAELFYCALHAMNTVYAICVCCSSEFSSSSFMHICKITKHINYQWTFFSFQLIHFPIRRWNSSRKFQLWLLVIQLIQMWNLDGEFQSTIFVLHFVLHYRWDAVHYENWTLVPRPSSLVTFTWTKHWSKMWKFFWGFLIIMIIIIIIIIQNSYSAIMLLGGYRWIQDVCSLWWSSTVHTQYLTGVD